MIYFKNFTLDGTVQSLADLDADSAPVHRPIKWIRIENTTGNADIQLGVVAGGVNPTLSATVYGRLIEDGPTAAAEIGPFGGGECPFNLEDLRVLGTDTQILHLMYMTL